jgi:hypothetical protein
MKVTDKATGQILLYEEPFLRRLHGNASPWIRQALSTGTASSGRMKYRSGLRTEILALKEFESDEPSLQPSPLSSGLESEINVFIAAR